MEEPPSFFDEPPSFFDDPPSFLEDPPPLNRRLLSSAFRVAKKSERLASSVAGEELSVAGGNAIPESAGAEVAIGFTGVAAGCEPGEVS